MHAPLRLADEVALVLAVQSGLLDTLPLPTIAAFRRDLTVALDRSAGPIIRAIEETGELNKTGQGQLIDALRRILAAMTPDEPAP